MVNEQPQHMDCRRHGQKAKPATNFGDNMIDWLWQNFISPDFVRYPNFLTIQHRIVARKPPCKKTSLLRPVILIQYRLVTDGETGTHDDSIHHATIVLCAVNVHISSINWG